MRVVVINGSARGEKGVTHKLVEALAKGLFAGGASVEILQTKNLKVSPCLACLACLHKTPGRCAQRDDMDRVYPLLQESDMVVWATPVYTDGPSAQIKAVMDRCICAMRPFLVTAPGGRVRHPWVWSLPPKWALVSTCGLPEPENFTVLKDLVRTQASSFEARVVAEICVPGSIAIQMRPEILVGHLELIERAGRKLAADGELDYALDAALQRPPVSADEYLALSVKYEDWCRRSLAKRGN
jgi:hypothetical protein